MLKEINRIHGGNIHSYLNNKALPAKKIIDFSANINPLGLPKLVKKTIIQNIKMLVHYPQPYSQELKNNIAAFHNIKRDNLLIGNGSIELIYLISQALKTKTGVIITPTFSEYEFALRLNKTRPVFCNTCEQNNFQIDKYKLLPLIKNAGVIFLCNPNNPTGTISPRKAIWELLHRCIKHKTVLVIDEAFMDFIKDENEFSLIGDASKYKNILILRSMTKFFAFAGLRIGYVIGHKNLIKKISPFQYPWNVNYLAQIAAQAVVNDKDYIKKSKDYILKEKDYLFKRLKNIDGVKVYPPCANFILCRLTGNIVNNTKVLSEKLAEQGIIIRNCSDFRGLNDKFFRVAVKKREENNRFIQGLRTILVHS